MSEFSAAFETAISAAGIQRAYKLNSVPSSPAYPYVVWSVTFDEPTTYRNDATHGVRFYRATWQAFSKSFDGADALNNAFVDAFLDHSLTVSGWDCGPMNTQHGGLIGRPERDPDNNGVVGVTTSLTFAATKE